MYNAQYFIDKFTIIPDDKWATNVFFDETKDAYCALGHCGQRSAIQTEEANGLSILFGSTQVHHINDGFYGYVEPKFKTAASLHFPKERILAALEVLKEEGK